MPFKSKAQQVYMFAQHPEIAKKWVKKYGVSKDLPEHVKSKGKKNSNSSEYSQTHYKNRRRTGLD